MHKQNTIKAVVTELLVLGGGGEENHSQDLSIVGVILLKLVFEENRMGGVD